MDDAYLGPGFSTERCVSAAEGAGLGHEKLPREEVPGRAAAALASGRILAWFQGRMEWGPRALGHRSFLADPRDPRMKESLNERIKLREPFRPFAPSMLEEATSRYFGRRIDSPYMLLVLPVVPERRDEIPAVVHVDGSMRPQTVTASSQPRYHGVIERMGKARGIPVILNTSLNVKGEPIACAPMDALRCFFSSGIDALALQGFWVEKT
jgi:carbamoyltransferase